MKGGADAARRGRPLGAVARSLNRFASLASDALRHGYIPKVKEDVLVAPDLGRDRSGRGLTCWASRYAGCAQGRNGSVRAWHAVRAFDEDGNGF